MSCGGTSRATVGRVASEWTGAIRLRHRDLETFDETGLGSL